MRRAFTLAEVLITLAIIGVIAAITIPAIVANHQKTALEAAFAKSYRTFSQAVNMAIAEYGGIETWDFKDSMTAQEVDDFAQKYITPYLNVAKYCPAGKSAAGCFKDGEKYYLLNGNYWNTHSVASNLQSAVLLADGSCAHFITHPNSLKEGTRGFTVRVDVNGAKKPNVSGLDVFAFDLFPQTGEFLPRGINAAKINAATSKYDKRTKERLYELCTREKDGSDCAARIVADGFKITY